MAVARPPAGDLVLIAVAVAAVSTSAPLIREAQAPALAIAFWRNAFAVTVLVPVCAARRRAEVARLGRGPATGALLAGLLLSAHFATWVPSLSYTTVASWPPPTSRSAPRSASRCRPLSTRPSATPPPAPSSAYSASPAGSRSAG